MNREAIEDIIIASHHDKLIEHCEFPNFSTIRPILKIVLFDVLRLPIKIGLTYCVFSTNGNFFFLEKNISIILVLQFRFRMLYSEDALIHNKISLVT